MLPQVMVPLFCMVATSWTVFTMDPRIFVSRLSVVISLLTAAAAYTFVVKDVLPRAFYPTCLGRMIFSAFILIFLTGVESFVAHVVDQNGGRRASKLVDFYSIIIFPIVTVMGVACLLCSISNRLA